MKKHDLSSIDKKIEELTKQAEENKNKYLRALADYQNLEKRTGDYLNDLRILAAEKLIIKLLPVLDSFERAQNHIKDPGLELSIKQFNELLDTERVKKINAVGRVYDPQEMECVEVVEGADNIVVEEVNAGYYLDKKLLRPAKVKVGKKSKNN